jgi:hypothetical protein
LVFVRRPALRAELLKKGFRALSDRVAIPGELLNKNVDISSLLPEALSCCFPHLLLGVALAFFAVSVVALRQISSIGIPVPPERHFHGSLAVSRIADDFIPAAKTCAGS